MHGDITIESEEGIGSEFIFKSIIDTAGSADVDSSSVNRLKNTAMDIKSSHEEPLVSIKEKRDVKTLHILVAEDNEINQLVITAILEKMGVIPVVVANGEEAVARIKQETFDAVLMDCQMPVLDGYRATEEIRKLAGFKDLPIFALTADVTAEGKDKAQKSGFSGHLSKPILVDDLLEKLESI